MERKILLAVVLSSLLLLGYNFVLGKAYHLNQPAVLAVKPEEQAPQPAAQKEPAAPTAEIKLENKTLPPISLEQKVLESNDLRLTFSNLGAAITEISLPKLHKRFFEEKIFTLQGYEELPFRLASASDNRLIYVYADAQKKISKIYSLLPSGVELELQVQNLGKIAQDIQLNLNYFSLNLQQQDASFQKEKSYLELVICLPDNVLRKGIAGLNAKNAGLVSGTINWLGVKDRYFCSIVAPEEKSTGYFTQVTADKIITVGIPIRFLRLEPAGSAALRFKLYAGPLNMPLLTSADSGFKAVINYGFFDSISKGLLAVLRFVHNFLPNWGLCIIALSSLLFFLLFPLTIKSLKSMKAMQALQPEMEKMRQQYKSDPQKFNKETMELYRKNKVNPFGGCLPMLLQIPVFIALYQALLRSLELRGSGFLWIKDLSEPDRLFMLPTSLPFLGNEFNILPILMAMVMFVQQKYTTPSTASTSADQQKMMTIFMPILFGVMFYRMPSGLVLYWFVYSGLSLIFQWKQLAPTKTA